MKKLSMKDIGDVCGGKTEKVSRHYIYFVPNDKVAEGRNLVFLEPKGDLTYKEQVAMIDQYGIKLIDAYKSNGYVFVSKPITYIVEVE